MLRGSATPIKLCPSDLEQDEPTVLIADAATDMRSVNGVPIADAEIFQPNRGLNISWLRMQAAVLLDPLDLRLYQQYAKRCRSGLPLDRGQGAARVVTTSYGDPTVDHWQTVAGVNYVRTREHITHTRIQQHSIVLLHRVHGSIDGSDERYTVSEWIPRVVDGK